MFRKRIIFRLGKIIKDEAILKDYIQMVPQF